MRHLISKFRDFSRIFLKFLGTFPIFEHIYQNTAPIFKEKIYINVSLIFEVDIYRNAPLTKRFRASLKHKNAGQTKFIKPNSQR